MNQTCSVSFFKERVHCMGKFQQMSVTADCHISSAGAGLEFVLMDQGLECVSKIVL